MREQRKSNWQHPNIYYRKREETPGNDECDTSQHPHPYRTLPTKAVQIKADQARDVVLEAVHFLVEIGNPRHLRLTSIDSIRSYDSAAGFLLGGSTDGNDDVWTTNGLRGRRGLHSGQRHPGTKNGDVLLSSTTEPCKVSLTSRSTRPAMFG